MKYSIIIPAYNEELRIKNTLINYCKGFKNSEIIVVNNGSIDNTTKIIENLKKSLPEIKLLEFPNALGKGGAIIKGFKIAKGSIVGFVDSDDSFDIKGVKKLINAVEQDKCDCVIASKWKNRSFREVNEPFFRKIASRVWNIIIIFLFGFRIYDTQAGAKFMKSKVLEKIINKLSCNGFEFDVELLWLIKNSGFSIKEVFVSSIHKQNSTFKMKNSFRMLINIIKVRLRDIR